MLEINKIYGVHSTLFLEFFETIKFTYTTLHIHVGIITEKVCTKIFNRLYTYPGWVRILYVVSVGRDVS